MGNYFSVLLFLLGVNLFSLTCIKTEAAGNNRSDQSVYSSVDKARVREGESVDSKVIGLTVPGERFTDLKTRSKEKYKAVLRGKEYNEPFCKIEKINGVMIWKPAATGIFWH